MKGYKVTKSFFHKKTKGCPTGIHNDGEMVKEEDINPVYYEQLEKQAMIVWVERPEIVMPKKAPVKEVKPKAKKNVRKGKK